MASVTTKNVTSSSFILVPYQHQRDDALKWGSFPAHLAAIYDAHFICTYATLQSVIFYFQRIYIYMLCTLRVSGRRGNVDYVVQIAITYTY